MANGDAITTKFKVDISDFKKGITEANNQIKLANAQFKAATAGMDDWQNSSEGIKAKLSQLQNVLNQQVSKLKNYKDQLSAVETAEKKNGERAAELKAKLQELSDQGISKTSAEYKKYVKELNDVEKEQKANKDSADKLRITILNQQGTINATTKEMRSWKSQLDTVENSADDLSETLDDVDDAARHSSDGFTVMKGALANLVADGFRKAIDAAKDFAVSMIDVAAEVKASNSQFTQTFGELEGQASGVIDSIAEKTGILATRLRTTGAGIYAFARSSGATTSEAMDLMQESLLATADSAAYYDRSLEDSAETLQSFLKGNFANDAALGVSATEFTRNAKATELFGKKYNDLTEIQKQKTLLKMVTDSQKLSGAMGQAAREADGWENVQGNLNETWKQFKAQVGTPFLEELIPVVQEITKSFTEWRNSVDWDSFALKVKTSVNKIIDVFKWFITNRRVFEAAITGMIAAFAVSKIGAFVTGILSMVKAFQAAKLATEAATVAQAKNNATALANPYVAVATAIMGIVSALVVWAETADTATNRMKEELKEAENQRDVIKENKKAYDELNQAKQNAIDTGMTEMAHTENLWEELQKLVDANGQVKEGYEGRASYITSVLSEALGTEITMTDGIIDKYGELCDSIDTLMEKKKAQIILEAQEQAYTEAIQNQAEATRKLNELKGQLSMDEAKRTEYERGLYAAKDEYTYNYYAKLLGQLNETTKAHESAYNEQLGLYDEYAYNIGQYEQNMALAHEGKYSEMTNVTWQYIDQLREAGASEAEITQAKISDTQAGLDELLRLKKENNTNIYDEQIAAAQKQLEKLKEDLASQTSTVDNGNKDIEKKYRDGLAKQLSLITGKRVEIKDAGGGLVQAYINGVAEGQPQAESKMSKFANSVIQKVKDEKPNAETAGNMLLLGLNTGLGNPITQNKVKVTGAGIVNDTIDSMNQAGEINSPSRATERTGGYLLDGLFNGISSQSKQSSIFQSAWNFGKSLLSKLQESMEEHSPSKATERMGNYLLQGLGIGIAKEEKTVTKQITALGGEILKTFKTANVKNNYAKLGESLSKSFAKGINAEVKSSTLSVSALVNKTVTALNKSNKKASAQYKKAGTAVTKAYSEAIKDGAAKAITSTDNMLNSIADKFQTQYDEITRRKNSLNDLLGGQALYSEDSKGNIVLTNLSATTKAIKNYGADLEKLKKKLPENLMEEILGMDMTNGQKFSTALLKMSKAQLESYVKSYKARDKATSSISNSFYEKEFNMIEKSFTKEVTGKLGTLKSNLNTVGKNAVSGLIKGMKSQKSQLSDAAKTMANTITDTLKKSLKIHSPSKVMAEIGQWLPEGLSEGIDDNVKSVINSVKNLSDKVVSTSQGMFANLNTPAFAAVGGLNGSTTTNSNVNNFTQIINAPKQPSRIELYRQTKNLLSLK